MWAAQAASSVQPAAVAVACAKAEAENAAKVAKADGSQIGAHVLLAWVRQKLRPPWPIHAKHH